MKSITIPVMPGKAFDNTVLVLCMSGVAVRLVAEYGEDAVAELFYDCSLEELARILCVSGYQTTVDMLASFLEIHVRKAA